MRLVNRTLEELRVQANVSAPLMRPTIPEVTESPSNNPEPSPTTQIIQPADEKTVDEKKPAGEFVATPKELTDKNAGVENNVENATATLSVEEPMHIDDEKNEGEEKDVGDAMEFSEEKMQIVDPSSTSLSHSSNVDETAEFSTGTVGGKRARTESPEVGYETSCEKVILVGF